MACAGRPSSLLVVAQCHLGLISAEDRVGFSEMQKVQQLGKTFRGANKSPFSIVVIDNNELLIDWVPIGALKGLLAKQPPKVS